MLSQAEKERYRRQIGISNWGENGQLKLKKSRIFVAGAGGLGGALLYYLTAAGVGTITVCDYDTVSLSNLNRQILHGSDSINVIKTVSASKTLINLNPEITIIQRTEKITHSNIQDLIQDSHLIVDCVDNFDTRHILNNISVKLGIPFIHAGVEEFYGQLAFFQPPETACLACIIPQMQPHTTRPHIAGATAGVIGSLQAVESIKFLTGLNNNLKNKILYWDGLTMQFKHINIKKNPLCSVCSNQ